MSRQPRLKLFLNSLRGLMPSFCLRSACCFSLEDKTCLSVLISSSNWTQTQTLKLTTQPSPLCPCLDSLTHTLPNSCRISSLSSSVMIELLKLTSSSVSFKCSESRNSADHKKHIQFGLCFTIDLQMDHRLLPPPSIGIIKPLEDHLSVQLDPFFCSILSVPTVY